MKRLSLDAIVDGYDPMDVIETAKKPKMEPVTFWVPAEAKESWAKLQKLTKRKFGHKAREVLLALIEMTEAKAS